MTEYEQMLTLAPAPFVHAGTPEDFMGEEFELPVPDGEGWELKWVMPHPSNNKIQQYFWQRVVDYDDDETTVEGIAPGEVNLVHE